MAGRAQKDGFTAELDGPRALRPEEYESTIALLNAVLRPADRLGPSGPHAIQKEYPLALGRRNQHNMRVIVRDGEVVSHAAIYFSTLLSGNLSFKVGGINSVATHPEYRGRGLGSKVMRDCIKVMEDASTHLSILWTERHEFYRRLGYETAGSSRLFRLTAADMDDVPRDCDVVPYSPRRLPDVIRIHRRESLRTERTAKEYEAYLGLPKTRVLLAARGRDVTAYAVMGKGEDMRKCMHDWGGDTRDLLCLARGLAESTGTGEVIVLTPSHTTEFAQMLFQTEVPCSVDYLALMRVIDLEGLSSAVGDHLGNLLGVEFGIRRDESRVKISVGGEETIIEPERNLVRLLFGPDKPSSLLTGLSRETLTALDNALPIPLFVWGLDSV